MSEAKMGLLHLDPVLLKKLDLSASASAVVKQPLDHWPPLAIDRCLENAAGLLAAQTAAMFGAGWPVISETLTMPRKAVGPRPAVLSFAPARTLYLALVSAIDGSLPPPSRTNESWESYQAAGTDSSCEYAAQIDIASCYEYIEHDALEAELVLRSMNLPVTQAITNLLRETLGRTRGLPQMHWASDRLADTYLDILTRQLARDGFAPARYVDDIRIPADSWHRANEAIERAAEYARALGLALSGEKTRVYRTDTLRMQQESQNSLFTRHMNLAHQDGRDEINVNAILMGHYGETLEPDESTTDQITVMRTALWTAFHEWHSTIVSIHGGGSVRRWRVWVARACR